MLMLLVGAMSTATAQTTADTTKTQPIILEPVGTINDTTSVVAVIADKLNIPLVLKEYKIINKWYQYKAPDNSRIRGSEPYEQLFYDPTTKVMVDAKKINNKVIYIQLLSEWKK